MTDILLSESEKRIVQNILKTHCKNAKVFAFGSRVNGNAKPYSDLDLVIKADNALHLSDIACLKDEFCHSDLVFKVDICDWQSLDDDFKRSIENELVLI
ncbi:Predicted nucleotidyltransferases [Moraxella caprae]|uniref:Predicted nucleotidyltransferases n=1 Tax=Moraxella caprae TaxID=90240 RepID=A0A378R0G5_9GAMM|nr:MULTISPECIES: nucleotidyltransferase domain-containing protein [Moraxella]STZ08111.1 Predicted nucleotidyltransferases [Moraxella caprae]